jgi:hypothetical protein
MSLPDNTNQPRRKEITRGTNDYLRYTGLGFSMMGIILGFCLLGWWLDGLLPWRFPILTLVLSLLGIAGAMMHLFRETGRK